MEGFMKKNIVCQSLILTIMCMLFAGMACNKSTGTKTTPSAMVVLQPKAGQTFKVGDTINIKWQVNYPDSISSIVLWLYSLPDSIPMSLATSSFAYPDTTFSWVADSAAASNHCYIKLQEYFNNVPPDSSGTFSITY